MLYALNVKSLDKPYAYHNNHKDNLLVGLERKYPPLKVDHKK